MISIHIYNIIIEPMIEHWKKRMARWLGNTTGITIDVACGTGRQVEYLMNHGIPAIGLDMNHEWLAHSKEHNPNIDFICADALHLPFRPGAVSNILISLGLHEHDEEWRESFVQQVRQTIAADGQFAVIDFEKPWNMRSKIGRLFLRLIEVFAGRDHYRNGQHFIDKGGASGFAAFYNFKIVKQHKTDFGSSGTFLLK